KRYLAKEMSVRGAPWKTRVAERDGRGSLAVDAAVLHVAVSSQGGQGADPVAHAPQRRHHPPAAGERREGKEEGGHRHPPQRPRDPARQPALLRRERQLAEDAAV